MNNKKDTIIENFFNEALFTFDSLSCDCVVEPEYIKPGFFNEAFKVASISDKKLQFAFEPQKGLVRLSSHGTIEEKNILGNLLQIRGDNLSNFTNFFNRNGFLFPTKIDEYEKVTCDNFYIIMSRLCCVVELLDLVSNPKQKDYEGILARVLFLLFSARASIKCGEFDYESCEHSFTKLFLSNQLFQNTLDQVEAFSTGKFSIKDTIFGTYELNIADYTSIINQNPPPPLGFHDDSLRRLTDMYVNCHNCNEDIRKITDFLFHYCYEVQPINLMEGSRYSEPKVDNFTQQLKDSLIDIAKIIIKEEIDHNIKGVVPVYDSSKLEPKWKVTTLLSAIYFSLFYLRPNVQIYKRCENPRCNKLFLVNRTSTNRKYCDEFCRGRLNQVNYRAKQHQ